MKEGLPACEGIKKSGFDFDKIHTSINIENLHIIEENVVKNEVALRADMEAAIEAHEREDYVQFGYFFGKILETALEKPNLEETNAVSKQELASFVQGYFEATHVGRINITNLLECIYTADMAAMTLY